MSLQEFQRALCDMILDPTFAMSVRRKGAPALAGYRLTAAEEIRLVAVVAQRGMSVNCTLARANRFAPIADAFPLTCSLLKPHLRGLLDEHWSGYRPDNYQLAGEVVAFATFLGQKLLRRELDQEYAAEIFCYESAAWELIETLRRFESAPELDATAERSTTVRFTHDPHILFACLERDQSPPGGLPAGDYLVRLRLHGDTLDVDLED